jgi:hypothetical protein
MSYFMVTRCAPWASEPLNFANTILFDEWLNRQLPDTGIDALIALSGAGLKTGERLQEQGAIFICDRGSTHQRYQERR